MPTTRLRRERRAVFWRGDGFRLDRGRGDGRDSAGPHSRPRADHRTLMTDLGLERVPFAALNFWATLVGALFCLPFGWADRPHRRAAFPRDRPVALGAVVLAMCHTEWRGIAGWPRRNSSSPAGWTGLPCRSICSFSSF